MGRCDSASERYICTSHNTACINAFAFKESDPDCTVLDDFRPVDTKFVKSFYGECVLTDDGETQGYEPYGAWQFTECPNGGIYRFSTADPFYAGQLPDVQCDRVITGACVSNSNPSQFFCAVTKEVCEAEDGFSYLKSYQVASEFGQICKLCDAVPPQPETRFVEAGACIVPSTNTFGRCALIPEHCDGLGEEFYDPHVLSSSSNLPSKASVCSEQEGLHQVRVGRCDAGADQNVCTTDKTACRNSLSFRPNDESCLLVEDLDVTGDRDSFATTHFGHCSDVEGTPLNSYAEGRENYCVWGFSECKPATTDSNARPLSFGGAVPLWSSHYPTCHCDDVRTGACISDLDPSDMYCAVAASACGQGYTYQNVRTLELASGSNTICYLCRELADIPTLPPKPKQLPGVPSATTTGSNLRPSQEKNSKTQNENAAIVGIAVGAVVLVLILVFVIHYFSPSPPNPGEMGPAHCESPKVDVRGAPEKANPSMEEGQNQEDFVPQEDHSIT